jgi:hypothetical protein
MITDEQRLLVLIESDQCCSLKVTTMASLMVTLSITRARTRRPD